MMLRAVDRCSIRLGVFLSPMSKSVWCREPFMLFWLVIMRSFMACRHIAWGLSFASWFHPVVLWAFWFLCCLFSLLTLQFAFFGNSLDVTYFLVVKIEISESLVTLTCHSDDRAG